jgi:tetratricopeptide (TPR) repeat protein
VVKPYFEQIKDKYMSLMSVKKNYKSNIIWGAGALVVGFIAGFMANQMSPNVATVTTGCALQGAFTGGESTQCAASSTGMQLAYGALQYFSWIAYVVGVVALLAAIFQWYELHKHEFALKKNPDDIDALYKRARQNLDTNNLDDLLIDCKRILELNPENTAALNLSGVAYRRRREYRVAIKYFERALTFAPNTPMYKNNLEQAKRLLAETAAKPKSTPKTSKPTAEAAVKPVASKRSSLEEFMSYMDE